MWAEALDIPEISDLTKIEARKNAIKAAIGDRYMLLVIDDVWQVDDVLNFKIECPNCAHIATTNHIELAESFATEESDLVEVLDEENSIELIRKNAPTIE